MLLTTSELVHVTGVPRGSLCNMLRAGFIRPKFPAVDHTDTHKFTFEQALAIGTMWHSRRQGATVEAAVAANDWLCQQTLDNLHAAFDQGCRYIVLIGKMMSPRLVTAQSAFCQANHKMAAENGWPFVVIDVGLACERMEKILAAMTKQMADTAPAEPTIEPQSAGEERCPA